MKYLHKPFVKKCLKKSNRSNLITLIDLAGSVVGLLLINKCLFIFNLNFKL